MTMKFPQLLKKLFVYWSAPDILLLTNCALQSLDNRPHYLFFLRRKLEKCATHWVVIQVSSDGTLQQMIWDYDLSIEHTQIICGKYCKRYLAK